MHHQAETRTNVFLTIITDDHVFSMLLIVMREHDVFVPVNKKRKKNQLVKDDYFNKNNSDTKRVFSLLIRMTPSILDQIGYLR